MFRFANCLFKYFKNNFVKVRVLSKKLPISSDNVALKHYSTQCEPSLKLNTKSCNKIVNLAFNMLKKHEKEGIAKSKADKQIGRAKTVDQLLSISQEAMDAQRHALQVISILGTWVKEEKVDLKEFGEDSRFIKLCHVLIKNKVKQRITSLNKNNDLTIIMDAAAEDEAARLVENLPVHKMIKVFQSLGLKKKRSILILRSISHNLMSKAEKINLKQCADLLYSMSRLNFYDENLMHYICTNVVEDLNENVKKSSVVGSIVKSFGFLRYKDSFGTLETICDWFLRNHNICRTFDIFSLFITMGVLNFEPTQNKELFYKTLLPYVNIDYVKNKALWVDLVLALVILNKVNPDHTNTVLTKEFIEQIKEESFSFSVQLKLLLIYSYVENLSDYKIPVNLESMSCFQPSRNTKKELMVNSVIDSLNKLFVTGIVEFKIDSNMGFLMDAIYYLDNKGNPVKIKDVKGATGLTKIAILVHDYNDICRGQVELSGINVLALRLLKGQGFEVVSIPYTQYKMTSTLDQRVKYLETKLKTVVPVVNQHT